MRIGHVLLVLAATVTACTAPNAGPTAQPSPAATVGPAIAGEYYPLVEGSEWVYNNVSSGMNTGTLTLSVSKVAASGDGATTAEIKAHAVNRNPATNAVVNENLQTYSVKKSADSVVTGAANGKFALPLKLPLAVGLSWEDENDLFRVEGQESVTVPAGTYADAVRIAVQPRSGGKRTEWYAAGVGLIKAHYDFGAERQGDTVLASFKKP